MFSDEWDNFVLMALKNDPPPETVEDLKKAFYSGALTIMHMMSALAQTHTQTDAGMKGRLLYEEVHAFLDPSDHGPERN